MMWGFVIGAGVTAVFAVWEYPDLPFPYPERWKPEDLPSVPPPVRQQQRPIAKMISGVARIFFLAMALFWPAMFWVWDRRRRSALDSARYSIVAAEWPAVKALARFPVAWMIS